MNEVSTTLSFQERLEEKIKADIGSLLTDDDLKKIIATSVERLFFKPTKTQDRYGSWQESKHTFLETVIKQVATEQMEKCIKKYMKDNPDEMTRFVRDYFDKSVVDLFSSAFNSVFTAPLHDFQSQMQQKLYEVMNR